MESDLIIYRINSKICPGAGEFYVFFDNGKKAKNFPAELKKASEFELRRYFSNAMPASTGKLTAYCTLQQHKHSYPCDINIHQLLLTAIYGKPNKDTVRLTLFSDCRKEAIKEVIALRDAAARTGEWQLVFLKLIKKKQTTLS